MSLSSQINALQVSAKQMKGFIMVATTLSFAQASEQLHMSQPALSIAIKNLERTLGGALFVRSTRSLALSPEGQAFLPVAKRLLADWDQALSDIHNQFRLKQGRLQLAAMPSYAATRLAQDLGEFKQVYPDINVTVHDVVAEDVVTMVRDGKVELGLSFDPGDHDDLAFKPLFRDRFVAVVPSGHGLAGRASLTWSAINAEPFIALQAPSSMRELIEQKTGGTLKTSIDAHQLITIGQLVAAGLGVSIVPSMCQTMMEQQGAVCLPFKQPVTTQSVGLLYSKRGGLSAPASAFMGQLGA